MVKILSHHLDAVSITKFALLTFVAKASIVVRTILFARKFSIVEPLFHVEIVILRVLIVSHLTR